MKYWVTYRGEFGAKVDADSPEEAEKKFEAGECEIKPIGNLWQDYLKAEEVD